ncbi:zinc finger protein 436-like isoform X2 [Toxotes jaculatrix]|uniref:zinc finger protein 436-like isoform X2 n=1 Tax=Toxotes jaculatrix TaxID=941984 RepID=UPI001B3AFB94|nr:zinc finger protein 436-like isoform X2 [Toxotes jaculatrix]
MFQLRSFVHRRLYAAAEEILGEVEKTITLALYEAEVRRPKGEPHVTESPLTNSTVTGEEVLQETSTQEESDWSTAEILGSSYTSADTVTNDGNYCLVQTDFKIKEEQEELGDDSQTLEVIAPSPEAVKTEQDQPETDVINELPPVPSECSAAQSENSDSDEEWVQSKEAKVLQRQNGSMTQEGQAASPSGEYCAKSQKDRSVCPVCGKGFQYIRPFMKHLKTHNRASESTKELLSHLQSAHNKRLVCDVCGKKFTNPGCLHIHSKIHTGIKDFKCQDCGKSFVRKEHLIVHMRTHSGERPYNCDICGKAFTQSQNLTVHRRTHTGERPYQCGSCGKFFYTRGQLKKHMKRFSGEKPYSCHVCGKTFCQRGRMIRHENAHAAGNME